jgi:hypothetical protein
MIVGVTRTTSPGQRTEEQNRLFQSLYKEIRAVPGCEAVIVARRYDAAADITKAVTIFRWRDDASRQATSSCIQEVAGANGTGSSRLGGLWGARIVLFP